jgi:arginine decarboxylase
MTNIGTTRSSVAYPAEVLLVTIVRELDKRAAEQSNAEAEVFERAVERLTNPAAPLPNFSGFHPAFLDAGARPDAGGRRAPRVLPALRRQHARVPARRRRGRSGHGRAAYRVRIVRHPYRAGFPVLVPGQVLSEDILAFMRVARE